MLNLNLAHQEKTEISYKIGSFPDGEIQIKLGDFPRKDYIYVTCRICNANDLFILMQVNDILTRHGVCWDLQINYLMGARMDRVMDFNRPFTLSTIAKVLNGFSYRYCQLIEVHSSVATHLIRDCCNVNMSWDFSDKYDIVYPDKGACSRYEPNPENAIICSKVRDINSGALLGFQVDSKENLMKATKPLLIVDDLCDGGGTFCGIASKIKEYRPDLEISIAVTHMVNRKGLDNLSKTFKHVWFTNSYKDWEDLPDNITQIPIA